MIIELWESLAQVCILQRYKENYVTKINTNPAHQLHDHDNNYCKSVIKLLYNKKKNRISQTEVLNV